LKPKARHRRKSKPKAEVPPKHADKERRWVEVEGVPLILTQVEVDTILTQLETRNVKVTCEKMGYSATRYYTVVGGIVDKWGRSFNTHNWVSGKFKTAKATQNPLARHLTRVKRVTPVEDAGPVKEVETMEAVEPPQ